MSNKDKILEIKEKYNLNEDGVLLFVYKNNRAKNLQYLKVMLQDNLLINLGSHIVITESFYSSQTNSNSLNISNYNTGQYIFTYSRIKMLIYRCIELGLTIEDITFWEDIDKSTYNLIKELIKEAQRVDISKEFKYLLIDGIISNIGHIEKDIFNDNGVSSILFRHSDNRILFCRNNHILYNSCDVQLVKNILIPYTENNL